MGKDQNKMQERIDRLEKRVEYLEDILEKGDRVDVEYQSPEPKKPFRKRSVDFGEEWLNRIGIGLLLIGVAFLFKYSIDQGWLIPQIRSGVGLFVGAALFFAGNRLDFSSGALKQIFLGGGIAAFYLTGFATYQLYSFAPGWMVWIFMILITAMALSISLRQHQQVLSVVGTLGALGTPFMLYSGAGGVFGLMLYMCLVLAATSIIFFYKGWKGLLWSMAIGGFSVLFVGMINSSPMDLYRSELWALQVGVVVWMTSSWLLPVYRKVFSFAGINDTVSDTNRTKLTKKGRSVDLASSVYLISFLVPLSALAITSGIWEMTMTQSGVWALAFGGICGAIYFPLTINENAKLASVHVLTALVMLTIGLFLLLEGNVLFIVFTAEAVALHYIAYETGDSKIEAVAHIFYGIVMFWLINMFRLTDDYTGFFNLQAISHLIAMAAGGLLIPRWLRNADTGNVYRLGCHIIFMIWLYQKFSIFENGQAWITLAWGAYAVILLILGFLYLGKKIRISAMATIFVVVGKLFLVDLSQLQAIWRIMLFMGFGTVFLILGYYWQSNDKGSKQ